VTHAALAIIGADKIDRDKTSSAVLGNLLDECRPSKRAMFGQNVV
jgi:hypothetical protein